MDEDNEEFDKILDERNELFNEISINRTKYNESLITFGNKKSYSDAKIKSK